MTVEPFLGWLLGQSESKSTVEVINDNEFNIDQSTRENIKSDCMGTQSQSNVTQIIGSRVKNLTANQNNIAKNLCIMQTMINSTKDAGMQAQVMNKIMEKLEAQGGPLGGKTDSNTKIHNRLRANFDQSTVRNISKDCIMKQDQRNVIQLMGSDVEDSNVQQVNDAYAECMQNYGTTDASKGEGSSKSGTDIDKDLKSTGMDLFGSLASFGSFLIPVIICSLICASIVMASVLGGRGSE